jgi:hypothetical protein
MFIKLHIHLIGQLLLNSLIIFQNYNHQNYGLNSHG